VPRLDNASWLFFIFFSHDDILMALALWEEIAMVCVGAVPGVVTSPFKDEDPCAF
jgi:hypothetical protein